VILTSDNPRNEDPNAIIRDITAGMLHVSHYEIEADRERAIARAVALAVSGDIVLIAGKGHENYQEWSSTVVPFDDREVTAKYLNAG
jgi:UDP-N-acetylmuramoyl-L-alanyl-D-glutamate--2,6-diaminopimelate ligase